MKYKESIEFIEAVSWKGSRPGLERITELCRRLGNPERKMKYVHVAGTNGKGSVSAIVASVLSAAGYKTGLFTSPHLVDYTERIRIDGADISKRAFSAATELVAHQAAKMADAPTEFELLSAVAFVAFERAGCDVVVLECGMGGRLDSTNVIPSPAVSIITNIALDHTKYLGSTELAIAGEKAGIIKDSPVVIGKVSSEVEKLIKDKCKKDARLYSEIELSGEKLTRGGLEFTYRGATMTLPLCGEYQKINLRTALAATEVLAKEGFDVKLEDVKCGVSNVLWRGRFEVLSRAPVVIFDGAHNPDGAILTAKTFETLYPGERAVIVTGTMADKDYLSVAKILSAIAKHVITVKPDNGRALDASSLAGVYSSLGVESTASKSISRAVAEALDEARERGDVVLCTGSLYMYGDILRALRRCK